MSTRDFQFKPKSLVSLQAQSSNVLPQLFLILVYCVLYSSSKHISFIQYCKLERLVPTKGGAPPHYHVKVRNHLDLTFLNRWIRRRDPIEQPTKSPDLSPLDYFMQGHLKIKVYVKRSTNLQDLTHRIQKGRLLAINLNISHL